MTLQQMLDSGWTLDQIRRWAEERVQQWNLLEPLDGNRGWEYFVAKAHEQAMEIARQADAIDLSAEHVDRELVRLFTEWRTKVELATLLRDAREANQDATRILTQIATRMEKEPGNA